jgi:hypothetical protein
MVDPRGIPSKQTTTEEVDCVVTMIMIIMREHNWLIPTVVLPIGLGERVCLNLIG